MSAALVGVVGSRSLSGPGAEAVAAAVVAGVARLGRGLAVGCSAGADALVLGAAAGCGGLSVSVFAVGGGQGRGFWSGSAPLPLLSGPASSPRWSVSWWAGGACSCGSCACAGRSGCACLRRRLSARSRALVAAVAASGPGAGLVVLLARGASSRGSLAAAALAARGGVPVLCCCVGFPGPPAPLAALGSWFPVPAPFPGAAVPDVSWFRWGAASLFSAEEEPR